jgi:Second Messenger Oligonucleotide or Dinucleotide Synthetase domain
MDITELKSLSVAVNPLSVIDRIIAELELTPTQHSEAVKSYQDVAAVLSKLHPLWKVAIFPQGSMRLGTTVRPLRGERFDLDMVCWLALSGKNFTPDQVFNLVWDALGQDGTYRRVKKNRCIRLEYKDERKFYLDVTPAVSDWAGGKFIYVPDRELKTWCASDPVTFCDEWFIKTIAAVLPTIGHPGFINNRAMVAAANEATIEAVPQYGVFEKTPLQRIVQMLKRDRDEYFKDNPTHRPSSILLTTITARAYEGLVRTPVEDLLEFVVKVVAKARDYIVIANAPGSPKFVVSNPVNSQENFAEGWTAEHHRQFSDWHKGFVMRLQKLQQSKGRGTDMMFNSLSETFGREPVIKAARKLGADTNVLHNAGRLSGVGGALTVGAVTPKIPKTIYFGGEK